MTRYLWDSVKETWVLPQDLPPRQRKGGGLQVIRDIEPYKSMETGEIIGGRKQHRDHLRAHGLIEVGNERITPKERKFEPVKTDLERAIRPFIERYGVE